MAAESEKSMESESLARMEKMKARIEQYVAWENLLNEPCSKIEHLVHFLISDSYNRELVVKATEAVFNLRQVQLLLAEENKKQKERLAITEYVHNKEE
jgi:hypothetical protein